MGLPNFIEEKFTPARLPEFAINALSNFPLENHFKQLSRQFKSPKMKALLSFQDLYVGETFSRRAWSGTVSSAVSSDVRFYVQLFFPLLFCSILRSWMIMREVNHNAIPQDDKQKRCLPYGNMFSRVPSPYVILLDGVSCAGLSPYNAPAVFSLLQVRSVSFHRAVGVQVGRGLCRKGVSF